MNLRGELLTKNIEKDKKIEKIKETESVKVKKRKKNATQHNERKE